MEKVLVLIKPDGVKSRLIGKIIKRYEEKGLEITNMKMLVPTEEIINKHYADFVNLDFFSSLKEFMTSGRVCALIVEGPNAIAKVRKTHGATDPLLAEVGTVREMYAESKQLNIVHASDSPQSAEKEINIWFGENQNA